MIGRTTHPQPASARVAVRQVVLAHRSWYRDALTRLFSEVFGSSPRRGQPEHAAEHFVMMRDGVMSGAHLDGVDDVLESDRYDDALPGADLVVLALALTPETEGIISIDELALMEDHAWLVNVARGRHVVTDDLVVALRDGMIGGLFDAIVDIRHCVGKPGGNSVFAAAKRPGIRAID